VTALEAQYILSSLALPGISAYCTPRRTGRGTWTESKRCGDADEHEEMGYGEEVGAEEKYH